jgi:hypothetical protein
VRPQDRRVAWRYHPLRLVIDRRAFVGELVAKVDDPARLSDDRKHIGQVGRAEDVEAGHTMASAHVRNSLALVLDQISGVLLLPLSG